MHPSQNDLSYIWDIVDAARDIQDFIKDSSPKDFLKDKRTRFAVERQFLVIGEAAKNISEAFRSGYPEVPWKKIIGLRNIIVHEYGEILGERIWLIAKDNIPDLLKALERFLS